MGSCLQLKWRLSLDGWSTFNFISHQSVPVTLGRKTQVQEKEKQMCSFFSAAILWVEVDKVERVGSRPQFFFLASNLSRATSSLCKNEIPLSDQPKWFIYLNIIFFLEIMGVVLYLNPPCAVSESPRKYLNFFRDS